MTIANIISSYYNELKSMCRDKERIVSEGRTDEDWLNDICLTALKKYRDTEIDEDEGKEYLKKNLLMSLMFKYKKIDNKISYMEDMELKNY